MELTIVVSISKIVNKRKYIFKWKFIISKDLYIKMNLLVFLHKKQVYFIKIGGKY